LNLVKDKILQINSSQFLEIVTESNFKESVKNKIYFYDEKSIELENFNDNANNFKSTKSLSNTNHSTNIITGDGTSGNTSENILDKCLICDEYLEKIKNSFDKSDVEKTNLNTNIKYNSEIEDDLEEQEEISKEQDNCPSNSTEENICKCPYCKSKFHLICLAQSAIWNQNSQLCLIPKDSECLVCGREYKWAEFLK
jgi:hypothetical protein